MQLKVKSTNTSQRPITLDEPTPERPDPEVPEKKPRRRFTAKYKPQMLSEVDSASHSGIGAILRWEGLYYSNFTTSRRQRQEDALKGLSPKKRGRKKQPVSPDAQRIAELERENRKLAKKLKQAEIIIDVQKKISEILGVPKDDDKTS